MNIELMITPGAQKFYNGVEGERIRTRKLMGQLSQGLVLDLKFQHISVGTIVFIDL